MRTVLSALLATLVSVSAAGCVCGGLPGTQDRLVFSSAVRFQDADALSSPIAVGATVVIAVEATHNATASQNAATLAGVTLRAVAAGHAGTATVQPLMPGQWSVRLDAEGAYTLVAADASGATMDTFALRARRADALRLGAQVTVVSHGSARTGVACVVRAAVDPRDLVLHTNQEVELVAVATRDAEPVAGLLDLVATGTAGATLAPRPAGRETVGNTLVLSAPDAGGTPVDVDVHDRVTGQGLTVHVATAPTAVSVACP